ncbi:MAG: hypothetical protein PHR43_04060 [Dehalococcoidales bacterium]|nr:hypothetical protein [Dehalococcoidales bacterium]
MTEELGKIEKPEVKDFQEGRKLYFVPLVYCGKDSPIEYVDKYYKYWEQVEKQISDLEAKLGKITHIYHELVPADGEEGIKIIKALNEQSSQVMQSRLDKGAKLEALEENEIITELMDWSRCLSIGLQNEKAANLIYELYLEVSKKRNEQILKRIKDTLPANEIGVLFMMEGHQITFPSDIQLFYVAPPALDEMKRWLRDQQTQKEKLDKKE